MPINSFLYPGAKFTPAYEVANSLRFNDGSSDFLSRTAPTPIGSRRIFTVSCWVKRTDLGSTDQDFYSNYYSTDNMIEIRFQSNDSLRVHNRGGASTTIDLRTTRKFRDVSAWYHVVVAFDTTQSTASDRVKIYINGVQETSFTTSTYPSLNQDLMNEVDGTYTNFIGKRGDSAAFFDGYLAESVYVNNSALDATSFGEFDEDTNIWKPIDVSGLTFGTNGFYLDFENSSSLGADVSGNGNNFTVNNLTSIDQTTDTCTNNFATLNPLEPWSNRNLFSEGNLVASGQANAWQLARGTIGVSQGKWYWEVLFSGGTVSYYHAGVQDPDGTVYSGTHGQAGTTTFYNSDGGEIYTGSSDAFTTNDYGEMNGSTDTLGVALNMDDKQISFYKNGSAIVSNYSLDTPNDIMMPLIVQYGSSQVTKINFGNAPFSISSGNSDANGYGNFEYSVPSGYYALNTKNLAEYG